MGPLGSKKAQGLHTRALLVYAFFFLLSWVLCIWVVAKINIRTHRCSAFKIYLPAVSPPLIETVAMGSMQLYERHPTDLFPTLVPLRLPSTSLTQAYSAGSRRAPGRCPVVRSRSSPAGDARLAVPFFYSGQSLKVQIPLHSPSRVSCNATTDRRHDNANVCVQALAYRITCCDNIDDSP